MGILTHLPLSTPKQAESSRAETPVKHKKGYRPAERPSMSAAEIRQKVDIERSKKQASIKQKLAAKQKPDLKQELVAKPVKGDMEIPKTKVIDLNDPTSVKTQEKLRSVLSSGAFSFDPREKQVLEQILNKG